MPRVIEGGNPETCEHIHLSVTEQVALHPQVHSAIEKYPRLVETRLLPLEEEIRQGWTYEPGQLVIYERDARHGIDVCHGICAGNTPQRQDTGQARNELKREKKALDSILDAMRKAAKRGKTVMENVASIEDEAAADDHAVMVHRAMTQFDESAVSPVWDEINSSS